MSKDETDSITLRKGKKRRPEETTKVDTGNLPKVSIGKRGETVRKRKSSEYIRGKKLSK